MEGGLSVVALSWEAPAARRPPPLPPPTHLDARPRAGRAAASLLPHSRMEERTLSSPPPSPLPQGLDEEMSLYRSASRLRLSELGAAAAFGEL